MVKWILVFVLAVPLFLMPCQPAEAQVTSQQIWDQTAIAWHAYQAYRLAEDARLKLESESQMYLNQWNACRQIGIAMSETYDERALNYLLYADYALDQHKLAESLLPAARTLEQQKRERFVAEGLKLEQMLAAQRAQGV